MLSKLTKTSMDKLSEECAVFGISQKNGKTAAELAYNGLVALQHRGQEGAGIAALKSGNIALCRSIGLVSELFASNFKKLSNSSNCIGHTRYSTEGEKNSEENLQPFVSEYLTGRIALAHNGNLTNADALRKMLLLKGLSFKASSDSEVISALIAYEITKAGNTLQGIKQALCQLDGAFSLIILSSENKLIAARDKMGYRPLCIGRGSDSMCVSSESCAIDSLNLEFMRNVEAGEIVVIENGEVVQSEFFAKTDKTGVCIFEYIYFARPDSVIDGQSVFDARLSMGKCLARESRVDADVVCGVPDSGLEAAEGYSLESGLPLIKAFVKNRYIGRSFIYPSQLERENAVKLKLNPLRGNVEGKRIVLIDDSIVRGTTCAQIINALKGAGAKQVHLRISSPPFIHSCYWGTDIGSEKNLIANQYTIEGICKRVGADSLAFISIDGVKRACNKCRLDFCTYCFIGE